MCRIFYFSLLIILVRVKAQENLTYQKPPEEILNLVDVDLPPRVLMDENKNYMVCIYRDAYKTIKELSEEEMRLAGLRINPKTNIGNRTNYYKDIKIANLRRKNSTLKQVRGLPTEPRLSNFIWSPDQSSIAFTNTTSRGVELLVLDVRKGIVIKLTEANVNANLGDAINWYQDGKSLLVKLVPDDRKDITDTDNVIPIGPRISSNDGKKAQNRTYQDLLKNRIDEHNFEQLALSEIYKVTLYGKKTLWQESGMYRSISFSPNGEFVMITTIQKPFSYLVPYYRFPSKTIIYTKSGDTVRTLIDVPLIEDLPKGFMAVRKGKRNFSWRNDKPASVYYSIALDEGDPENEVSFRDEIFQLDAPFQHTPISLIKTENRYYNILWCNDTVAVANDYWWDNRNTKSYLFNPLKSSDEPQIISDRNYQDRYNDPGDFVEKRNKYGRYIIAIEEGKTFLLGDGFTEKGQFPFLDQLNINTFKKQRLYESDYTDKMETLQRYDIGKDELLVRIQSPTDYPNYYFRYLGKNKLDQVTQFDNPFKGLENVYKDVIKYKREDGLDLSATLYLPAGYDQNRKERLPMIMWAYPREFKDKSSASQTTQNPNEFTYPFWGSPIYWLTKGYAILDGVSFPIVGIKDNEPNDDFRKQLVANAKAAIDAVDSMGFINREKVAIGGHSYGAFMVANLLSHSDLFAAGIARSGAYNRTLTPFGFQSEERNYWEAPDVYYQMSPFMHSDKVKSPILLIHGEADNNSGTYPLQSERYFNALKGLGATTRLVMLPKESHGYRAKESILHLLWEQDQWLEKYLKN
tara:strand:+ start:61 stop:2469 length:2409 start_codon:yes stop_codon:yes gene_type:complete